LGERWAELVQRLSGQGGLTALARELAWQGGLEAIDTAGDPQRWTLRVERETLRAPALRDKLATALQAELGHAVVLELLPGTPADTPARREAAARARRQAEAEAAIAADPLVQGLLGQFKTARVVPGSIKPA
jgi:DNA polymerase-3 subunit gamma/tau